MGRVCNNAMRIRSNNDLLIFGGLANSSSFSVRIGKMAESFKQIRLARGKIVSASSALFAMIYKKKLVDTEANAADNDRRFTKGIDPTR